jgi:hypothetical protein
MGVAVSRGFGDKLSGSCRHTSERCEAVLAQDREDPREQPEEDDRRCGGSWKVSNLGLAVVGYSVCLGPPPNLVLYIFHHIIATIWQMHSQVLPTFAVLSSST